MNIPYSVAEKFIVSGAVLEHYSYEKPYFVGFPRIRSFKPVFRAIRRDQVCIRDDNVRRTRQKIRRLVNSNQDLLKFMTLTFKENVSLEVGNKHFDIFIKRLRRLYPSLKYIAIPEFQKRGAIHYHLLTNIPYIKNDDLASLWGVGFAWLRKIDNIDNLGAYVCKYLGKANFDKRYFKKKKFFYSLNLLKPIILDKIEDVKAFISSGLFNCFKKVFSFVNFTDFLGSVSYTQYKSTIPFELCITQDSSIVY